MQRWGGGGGAAQLVAAVPTGSGLGTSSILAGALLSAVYSCTGQTFDRNSLIHAVLHLEQTLTTGGGWQDQVGGLIGGLKVGRSLSFLPLKVEVQRISPPEEFLVSLQQRLLLVYTGRRAWPGTCCRTWCAAGTVASPQWCRTFSSWWRTQRNVLEPALKALSRGWGGCLSRSWQQKKRMSPGCEPSSVRKMMEALEPLVLGQSLVGAASSAC
ncbi:hypothetical protein CgunFtcFv8_012477 [Champsocephalus gunnari]|uniref:GHMP kinase N-terminal domain-containing protein n=1 Tax=Champsocephalus gunnari TaxID=52237 RepID=A0AAN8HXU6_CHAGU|nr:hypothetical protein CgunFtcFv8_012477 [Champsocephalus gunnari]